MRSVYKEMNLHHNSIVASPWIVVREFEGYSSCACLGSDVISSSLHSVIVSYSIQVSQLCYTVC